ncbi:hypothetical protein EB796_002147 [Bugula neritina]|uniref:Uncharacterized protein n=1 Tax=Bugula neritina TaxID=10212 RepID=A0A7J7KMY5_BUGNE|nr:hypothetical protein EB796_002147 [Bugula neritina]
MRRRPVELKSLLIIKISCKTLRFHVVISSKSAKIVQSVQIHQIAGNDKVLVANLTPSQEKENLWTGEHPIKTDEKKFEYYIQSLRNQEK